MNSQQVDDRLLALLNELPYFSRLGTCLLIRLADHAAQICGCRSTRQVDDSKWEDVDEQFNMLLTTLYSQIHEGKEYLNNPHTYKQSILLLNDDSLENYLEDVLYEMSIYDCSYSFIDMFFEI